MIYLSKRDHWNEKNKNEIFLSDVFSDNYSWLFSNTSSSFIALSYSNSLMLKWYRMKYHHRFGEFDALER
jgi:hypothetical protein